jgi:hypothetical protein
MAGLALGLLPVAAGCNLINPHRPPVQQATGEVPTADKLVVYLNDNARKVQAVQSLRVEMDCKQGAGLNTQSVGLDGLMVCQKPRNFRLKAKVVGQPAVDIGSNDQEFWYWISKAEPPYVYHCGYDELARGNVNMPFPFQPDMLIMALGLAEYDPAKKYEVKTYDKTFELVEQTVSPQGQPIKKVTVFNRTDVGRPGPGQTGQPQILAYKLKDTQDHDICTAVVYEAQGVRAADGQTVVLPYKVKLSWPDQKVEMTMWLRDLQAVNIEPDRAGRLFSRQDLADLQGFDLARRTVDGAPAGIGQTQSYNRSGIRQTSVR